MMTTDCNRYIVLAVGCCVLTTAGSLGSLVSIENDLKKRLHISQKQCKRRRSFILPNCVREKDHFFQPLIPALFYFSGATAFFGKFWVLYWAASWSYSRKIWSEVGVTLCHDTQSHWLLRVLLVHGLS